MKRYITSLLLSALLLLAGCVNDDAGGGAPPQDNIETILTLRIAGNTGGGSTRALGPGDENNIQEIDILVFSKSTGSVADADAVYSYRAQTTRIVTDEVNSSKKSFRVTLKKDGSHQRLVIFANSRATIETLIPDFGNKTYAQVMASLVMTKAVAWNSTTDAYDPLPMWGQSGFKIYDDAVDAAVQIDLIRSLARINVVVDAAACDDFTMNGVWLYNPSTKGLLAPGASNWNAAGIEVTAVSLPSDGRFPAASFEYAAMTAPGTALEGVIYTFEAPAAAGNTSATDACLVVQGSWKGEPDSYYRIDFHDGTEFLPLLRNFRYDVSIDEVKGRGYSSASAAISAGFTALTATTQIWNEGDMGSVVWDGSHYLAVSDNEYVIYPEAQAVAYINAGTNYSGGWEAAVTLDEDDQANWLRIDAGAETGAGDRTARAINMTVLENDHRDRTAVITVTAGRLKQKITITQKVDQLLELDAGDVEVIFSAESPGTFMLPVEWQPAVMPVKLKLISPGMPGATGYPQLNGYSQGIAFTTNSLAASLSDDGSIGTDGGSAMLAMCPDAAALATFAERRSVLEMTVDDGTGENRTMTKTVLLRQFDYAIAVTGMSATYQLGTTYSLTLKANAQWAVEISGDVGEITVPVLEGEPNTSGVTFRFTTGNTENTMPVLRFYLKEHPDVQQIVNVSLYRLEPNCYIVHPQTFYNTVTIPIRKVYNAWATDHDLNDDSRGGTSNAMQTNNFSTGLLWQDRSFLINDVGDLTQADEHGTFTVEVNQLGLEGNAVVYLAENGVIRWSWHIWVLGRDNDPTTGEAHINEYTGDIIMDRDLGAITNFAPVNGSDVRSHGLLYQWGRKDPFPGANTTNSDVTKDIYDELGTVLTGSNGFRKEQVNAVYNFANALKNPLAFYYNTSSSYYDSWWYSSKPQSEVDRTNLWTINNVKTIYDPCPEGWKIPVYSFLNKVVHDVNDYNANSGIRLYDADRHFMGFFPMSGYMLQTNGDLLQVGAEWYGHLASRNQGMTVVSRGLTATAGLSNGRGVPARCIKVR